MINIWKTMSKVSWGNQSFHFILYNLRNLFLINKCKCIFLKVDTLLGYGRKWCMQRSKRNNNIVENTKLKKLLLRFHIFIHGHKNKLPWYIILQIHVNSLHGVFYHIQNKDTDMESHGFKGMVFTSWLQQNQTMIHQILLSFITWHCLFPV